MTQQIDLDAMLREFAAMIEGLKGFIFTSVAAIHSRSSQDVSGNFEASLEQFRKIERSIDGVRNVTSKHATVSLLARLRGRRRTIEPDTVTDAIQQVESRAQTCLSLLEQIVSETHRDSANLLVDSLSKLGDAVCDAARIGTDNALPISNEYFIAHINDAFRVVADEQQGLLYQQMP